MGPVAGAAIGGDAGSESGTYLNDVKLSQNNQIPFGSGSIVKFGDYTFNVE